MTILNADGSRPEMCGNGLRCVAGWLAERGGGDAITVRTDAGDKRCAVRPGAPGRYEVVVDMGRAQLRGEVRFGERSFALVDVGNPHAVCFEELAPGERERLAPALSRHLEGGVNVELCTLRSADELGVVVFERGVGWTDACGTGACAAVVAAVARGLCRDDAEVAVHLPGGVLAVRATEGSVMMRGPAGRVFVGEVVLPNGAVGLLE
jgi:diaminopimelate epimerase